jgi:hypothetical protein
VPGGDRCRGVFARPIALYDSRGRKGVLLFLLKENSPPRNMSGRLSRSKGVSVPFDYISWGVGIATSFLVIVFRDASAPLLFLAEVFAASICLWFLSILATNFFTRRLHRSEVRICFYQVSCNLIATLHLLSRLEKIPWDRFAG